MKQYLAVFMASPTSPSMMKWNAFDENARNEATKIGKEAWGRWVEQHQKSIVYMGGPLGKTKKVDPKGVVDIRNMMAAYVVVQGESHEDVAKLFLKHPHFMIFPGDSVEIMEVLPIPM